MGSMVIWVLMILMQVIQYTDFLASLFRLKCDRLANNIIAF